MSLSEEIKKFVGEDFIEAIDAAKDVYGTVSGAYAAYETVAGILKSLDVLEGDEDPFERLHEKLALIQKRLDHILKEIEQVRLEQAGVSAHITRTMIVNDESSVKSAAYNAYWFLKAPSADNESLFIETRDEAQENTNHFKENIYYWRRIHLEDLDYADEWSGTLSPPVEENIWVWDFIVTLPAYLSAVANWCIVILASDEQFQKAHFFEGAEMLGHINKLHEVLVKILKSFEPIRPPTLEEMKYVIFAADDSNFYQLGIDGVKYHLTPNEIAEQLKFIPGGKWRRSGYRCGTVEKYNGWAYYQPYPTAEITKGALALKLTGSFWVAGPQSPEGGASIAVISPDSFAIFYDRFIFMHTLRSWQQARTLSEAFSLMKLHDCIGHLCAVRNTAPPPLPPEWNRYVVASLRELHGIVPASLSNTTKHPGIRHLSEAMELEGDISLRRLFTPDA